MAGNDRGARFRVELGYSGFAECGGTPRRVTIVDGDGLDPVTLEAAMKGRDVVYANLAGDMKRQAKQIVEAMRAAGVKRLVFISSMGIYGEAPGERYRSALDPYRDSATVIEASSCRGIHPIRESCLLSY